MRVLGGDVTSGAPRPSGCSTENGALWVLDRMRMRRGLSVVLAVAAALVFAAGVYLAGVGSGFTLADRQVQAACPRVATGPTVLATPIAGHFPTATLTDVPTSPVQVETGVPPTVQPTSPTPTPAYDEAPRTGTTTRDDPLGVLREVWDIVQDEFYGELPDERALNYAAVRGVLGALNDDNTSFIEPSSAAIIGEDATGELEGIGAYVGLDQAGQLEIIRPFTDGPAAQAGLLAGDRILSVDDIPLEGKSLYDAIALIRGPAGTDVRLMIARSEIGAPFEALVTRARIDIPTTTSRMTEENVGYVRLHTFNASARESLEQSLSELLAEEPVGIVLDLRQNPGGWLDQAVEVADLFLREGIILIERWSDGSQDVYESQAGDLGEQIPLAVLVDAGSASASEIVGGALQDNGRAALIGEVTYGKGSVQRPHTLSDGSELRVTIAVWFTPNGRAIHAQGLIPDVVVAWPDGTATHAGDDPQLERAIQFLLEGR